MNVLLASYDNYAPLLGVALYSLLENNKNDFNTLNIFILNRCVSENNRNKIKTICSEFNMNIQLKFIKYDNIEEILGIKIKATRPLNAYARLFAAILLNENIDKILYLDCDSIEEGSFVNLWNMDLDNNYCGAVLDAGPKYINTFLKLPEYAEHYNSGFLLLNLKLWREKNIEKLFLEDILSNNGEIFHNDQGVINVICKDKILKLHPKYNIPSPFFEVGYEKVLKWYNITDYYNEELINESITNPIFIHLIQFVNRRPWFNNATKHPLRKLFDSYVKKTPFKDEVYIDDNRHFKGKVFSFLYKYLPYTWICGFFRIYEFF